MRRSMLDAAVAALVAMTAGCSSSSFDPPGADEAPDPTATRADLFAAIDPRIGTGGLGFGVGSTYPGPAVPFAMIHPSPDTRTQSEVLPFYHCSGYYADDPFIGGFSLVHFEGTGVPDYGTIALMPTSGMSDAKRAQTGYMKAFAKSGEIAKPGYYAVTLADGIGVEITASLRAATFRIAFPDGAAPVLLVDLDHRLSGETVASEVALDVAAKSFDAHVKHGGGMSGSAGGYDLYVHGVLDVAPSAAGTFDGAALHAGQSAASGKPLGAWLEFPAGTKTVQLRVAISFVDADGAKKNLAAEAPAFDFDGMRAKAEAAWKKVTDGVEIWGARADDATTMATALYHTFQMPTLVSDVDGRYVNVAGTATQGKRPRYSDFSLWDTYRTLHPWLLFAEDERNADFAATLVDLAAEGGAVPRWAIAHGDSHTMIGSPGEIVLAESALKGVPFDDEKKAYQLARVAAYAPSPGPCGGRDAIAEYLKLGYVPSTVGGSVSRTQEYAVADAALAGWAKRLGNGDAAELGKRGRSYARLYDPTSGFFRAKQADGSFVPGVNPDAMSDEYVEGNAWHYLFMAPHDPEGLAETLGGKDAALGRLREFFEASKDDASILGVRRHYWPSNEPDIGAPWLFAAWGSPAESWQWLDWIVTTFYGTGPDGIPGNDDGGTMSAWLLFAGVGLYPLPGTDRYVVAAPRFPKMVLHRKSGDLRLECSRWPKPGRVPKGVTLDGVPLATNIVTHAQLAGSHLLRFEIAAE
jgi:predicted alpha-1,2-mannosidase